MKRTGLSAGCGWGLRELGRKMSRKDLDWGPFSQSHTPEGCLRGFQWGGAKGKPAPAMAQGISPADDPKCRGTPAHLPSECPPLLVQCGPGSCLGLGSSCGPASQQGTLWATLNMESIRIWAKGSTGWMRQRKNEGWGTSSWGGQMIL